MSQRQVRRVLIIEGLINAALLATKLAVGIATNSLVILADAVHSVTDLVNNVIAWTVMKIADRPPDDSHPYGHRKFEVIAIFALATLLSVVAFELAVSSFKRSGEVDVLSSSSTLTLMIVVLVVNVATAIWQRSMAVKLKSGILEADASHTFSDVLTTVGVIVGWQLAAHGYPILDSISTLVVVGIIVWMSLSLFRKTLPVLVDGVALPSDEVRQLVAELEGVESVRRIRSRWVGNEISVDLVVTVMPTMVVDEAHDIADQIERTLEEKFSVSDTTVHIEPQE